MRASTNAPMGGRGGREEERICERTCERINAAAKTASASANPSTNEAIHHKRTEERPSLVTHSFVEGLLVGSVGRLAVSIVRCFFRWFVRRLVGWSVHSSVHAWVLASFPSSVCASFLCRFVRSIIASFADCFVGSCVGSFVRSFLRSCVGWMDGHCDVAGAVVVSYIRWV